MLEAFKFSAKRIDKVSPTFPESDAWQVTITSPEGKRLTSQYFMGYGHKGKAPELKDVFDTFFSDASCVAYRSLEEFADDMGYEINSISDAKQCERTYKACQRMAERLDRFLSYMSPEEREALEEEAQG